MVNNTYQCKINVVLNMHYIPIAPIETFRVRSGQNIITEFYVDRPTLSMKKIPKHFELRMRVIDCRWLCSPEVTATMLRH